MWVHYWLAKKSGIFPYLTIPLWIPLDSKPPQYNQNMIALFLLLYSSPPLFVILFSLVSVTHGQPQTWNFKRKIPEINNS